MASMKSEKEIRNELNWRQGFLYALETKNCPNTKGTDILTEQAKINVLSWVLGEVD